MQRQYRKQIGGDVACKAWKIIMNTNVKIQLTSWTHLGNIVEDGSTHDASGAGDQMGLPTQPRPRKCRGQTSTSTSMDCANRRMECAIFRCRSQPSLKQDCSGALATRSWFVAQRTTLMIWKPECRGIARHVDIHRSSTASSHMAVWSWSSDGLASGSYKVVWTLCFVPIVCICEKPEV